MKATCSLCLRSGDNTQYTDEKIAELQAYILKLAADRAALREKLAKAERVLTEYLPSWSADDWKFAEGENPNMCAGEFSFGDAIAIRDTLSVLRGNDKAEKGAEKPNYYIASKTKHAPAWQANRNNGDHITSTWIDEAGAGQTSDHSDLAKRCVAEIAAADFLVLYCELGEIQKGATIEAGIALGLGKEVRCVGTCDTISKTFIRHPLWRCFPSLRAAIDNQAEKGAGE